MRKNNSLMTVESGGRLEMFGPDRKPWREATDAFLTDAIKLAKTDSTGALALAKDLVAKERIQGIVRFRCSCLAELN